MYFYFLFCFSLLYFFFGISHCVICKLFWRKFKIQTGFSCTWCSRPWEKSENDTVSWGGRRLSCLVPGVGITRQAVAMAAQGSRHTSSGSTCGRRKLMAVSPSWARAVRRLVSQPSWAVSLARALAARDHGRPPSHLLLCGEDEASGLGRPSNLGLSFFLEKVVFFLKYKNMVFF